MKAQCRAEQHQCDEGCRYEKTRASRKLAGPIAHRRHGEEIVGAGERMDETILEAGGVKAGMGGSREGEGGERAGGAAFSAFSSCYPPVRIMAIPVS